LGEVPECQISDILAVQMPIPYLLRTMGNQHYGDIPDVK
jgi:hypothetical protein